MHNPFRGEGTITLSDGKPRLLRFNANSIIALQEVLGLDLGEIPALAGQSSTQKLLLIRAFLWAGLTGHKDGDKTLTLEAVGELVDMDRLDQIYQQLQNIYTAALTNPTPGKPEAVSAKLSPGAGQTLSA